MSSVYVDGEAGNGAPLRSKTNPFLDVPHDKKASEVKDGILQRKLHADIDGKRSEWDKRRRRGCFCRSAFTCLTLKRTNSGHLLQ